MEKLNWFSVRVRSLDSAGLVKALQEPVVVVERLNTDSAEAEAGNGGLAALIGRGEKGEVDLALRFTTCGLAMHHRICLQRRVNHLVRLQK